VSASADDINGGDNLRTVEQKPTEVGLGAPKDPHDAAADRDSRSPTRGAQSPSDVSEVKLKKPNHVAAGFPAVVQSLKFTLRETGFTRGLGTWRKINKTTGFDCQSCAWPAADDDRNFFELCESGAKAVASETTRKHVTPDFFRDHSIAELQSQTDYWLEKQGRLVHPMVKHASGTHYEPIEWDEVFALIGRELNALAAPDAAVFYTSGRTSNEAAFLYQIFVRQFGTNNLPDCSNMCHESSGAALNESIGIGKGCVKLEDFEKCDCIFILGQNPGTNHPRMLTTLERAKRNGATIVAINPLPEPGLMEVVNPNPQEYDNILKYPLKMLLNRGTRLSDLWLPVRINGDMAAMRGIMKEMLADEDHAPGSVFDRAFIDEYTTGFPEFIENLRATTWDDILAGSGLTREQICAAAQIAIRSKRIICCWAMGLTQHKNAVATIQEVMNFLLLGGNIGRPGAGPCPIRGHSNVQGDRTVGIWERMNDQFLDKLGAEFGFAPPRKHGFDTVNAIRQMHDGAVRVFFGMGGNFLAASPDTEYTARALQSCRLTAHVSTKLNRSHLVSGEIALILPCLGRSEIDRQASGKQFVTVEDSMGIINPSRGHLEPASKELLSEPAIVAGLAKATLGSRSRVDWDGLVGDYDRIRQHIEHVIPGFEKYNERARAGFFYLPNEARDERKFNNREGKAKFIVSKLEVQKLNSGEYLMTSIRSHDQFNTTIYGLSDRYRGVYNGRRVIFMNAHDVRETGLQQGQIVDLTSYFKGEERMAKAFMIAPFNIPRGCTATYFPEANVLISINSTADRSNTPTSKSIVIRITPSTETAEAVERIRRKTAAAAAR
jgi:molybdopterin-dependent oxidoreductase alpha subunit